LALGCAIQRRLYPKKSKCKRGKRLTIENYWAKAEKDDDSGLPVFHKLLQIKGIVCHVDRDTGLKIASRLTPWGQQCIATQSRLKCESGHIPSMLMVSSHNAVRTVFVTHCVSWLTKRVFSKGLHPFVGDMIYSPPQPVVL